MVALPVSGWDNGFDLTIMKFVVDHRTVDLTAVADAVMWVGTTMRGLAFVGVAAAMVVVALKAWRSALAAVVALAGSLVATAALKAVFERPRPPTQFATVITQGYSFPSTQASETAALVVAVILTAPWASRRVSRWAAGVLVALVLLVGLSMIYLGAHWPTDVLAGWLLGVAIGAVVGRAFATAPRGQRRSDRTPDTQPQH